MAHNYEPNDINAVLSRIETRLDNKAILDAERWQRIDMWMGQHTAECAEKNRRISKLENWRWYILGIVVGVSAVCGVLARFLIK